MLVNVERKPLEYYMNLKYPVTLYPDVTGGFVAEIKDLPGCLSQGETVEEAVEMIEEARRMWLEVAYEDGVEISEPHRDQGYSGKILVRIPKSIHSALDRMADREGVSLNQFLVATLAQAVGAKTGQKRTLIKESKMVSTEAKPATRKPKSISASSTAQGSIRSAKTVIKDAHRSRLHQAAASRII